MFPIPDAISSCHSHFWSDCFSAVIVLCIAVSSHLPFSGFSAPIYLFLLLTHLVFVLNYFSLLGLFSPFRSACSEGPFQDRSLIFSIFRDCLFCWLTTAIFHEGYHIWICCLFRATATSNRIWVWGCSFQFANLLSFLNR